MNSCSFLEKTKKKEQNRGRSAQRKGPINSTITPISSRVRPISPRDGRCSSPPTDLQSTERACRDSVFAVLVTFFVTSDGLDHPPGGCVCVWADQTPARGERPIKISGTTAQIFRQKFGFDTAMTHAAGVTVAFPTIHTHPSPSPL